MKIFTLIMLICCVQVSASVYSQNISISEKNINIEDLLQKIEIQSGHTFFYNSGLFKNYPLIKIKLKDVPLDEALAKILSRREFEFHVVNNTVVINKADPKLPGAVLAENAPILVTGKIITKDGSPLAGVTITAIGTGPKQVWVSDLSGTYSATLLNGNNGLLFSYLGYFSKEVKVSRSRNMDITLEENNSQLDQVQVLAYTTTSKRLSTGNSFTITSEELAKSPVPNVLQMIQKKVPGLQIIQNTGQVGGSFNVKIRGINGFNNVDPLYIVDGVPYPAGGTNFNPNGISGGLPTLSNNRGTGTLAQQGGNALNYLNPEDIESIDILKDADATAIYGSRGAYGVILITTKKGSLNKNGTPSLNVTLDRGLSVVGSFPELLGTADYLMLRREALKNDGLAVGAADVDLNGTYPLDAETNFSKELTDSKAWSNRVNLRYSGGTELTSYSVSGSFNDQDNVFRSGGYNRDGGLKVDLGTGTKDKKFNLLVSTLFNSTVNTMVPYEFSGDAATLRAPNGPSFFNPDGSLNWNLNFNPYSYINTSYRGVTNNLLGNTTLMYKPIKGLTIKALVGYNLLTGNELRQVRTSVFPPNDLAATAKANSASNVYNIRTWSFEPYASYSTAMGKLGNITAIAGATYQDKMIYQNQITGTGFVADARLNNPSSGTSVTTGFNKSVTRYVGYFGNISYNWANKYIVNFSTRYDGSTKFAPGKRFGWFGSAGGSWIFSEEKFIKENLSFLSFGKLRASYGTTGGDGIANYAYLATYSTGTPYLNNTVFTTSALANNTLHWETNKKQDYGISLGVLKDRILIDASYYKNKVSDQLLGQPLSNVTGFSSVTLNSPILIQNTGIEFSLSSSNIRGKNFSWSTSAVMTVPKSKVISMPEQYLTPNFNYVLGGSVSNIKVYNYAGVNPQTGEYNYINTAGIQGAYLTGLTAADKNINIDLSPRYYGSISNSLNYKTISLDFSVALVNKMGSNFQGQLSYLPGVLDKNTTSWALDRWQKPNDETNVPKATTDLFANLLGQSTFRQSSGAYERITYARLQNLSLSYSLPKAYLKRLHVNNLRVTLQGQNLLTISKYHDLDPENLSLTSLPPLKVFNLGLNVTL
ncbi:SusC/RagA family TonB-linked outer membrane protein [Pedobacter sp. Leaf194]|uniref:SusC/RagA family TonB-linked outer membrane protein n=1 Tax=Pedobacter sp. Leaf194 TaxID=1736297 RepID=UPI00138F6EDA|nr:SusC/RagA family TonB-linked outer membrane protein [Pedobacter sp. Leaf194]